MLIGKYELEVFTPPCAPGTERFAAKAHLEVDISEVLPYLNASLKGAVFHRAANSITWKKGGHNIAFHAFEIATSNVEDRNEAEKELNGLIDLVNRTWARRESLTPSFEETQRPIPLALYKLLPNTNCQQCGEQTCYTFALKLATSQKELQECPALYAVEYKENLAALQGLVG